MEEKGEVMKELLFIIALLAIPFILAFKPHLHFVTTLEVRRHLKHNEWKSVEAIVHELEEEKGGKVDTEAVGTSLRSLEVDGQVESQRYTDETTKKDSLLYKLTLRGIYSRIENARTEIDDAPTLRLKF